MGFLGRVEAFRHLLCSHCQNPVFVGEQPAVMRGTIVAHKACREESRRAEEYQREHPGISYAEALAAVRRADVLTDAAARAQRG